MTSAAIIMLVAKASLALVVFAIGLRSDEGDAIWLIRRPGLLARSILSMNVIVPLVALAVTQSLELPPPVRLAIVALALSPVPPILPNQTGKAGGASSYAIGLLTIVSLTAIAIVPLSAWVASALFGTPVHVMPRSIAVVMAETVLTPLGLGLLARRVAPAFALRAARLVTVIGMLTLAFAFVLILAGAWPAMRGLLTSRAVLATVLVTGAALLVGHELGGTDDGNRPVLALASATRHPAVAIAIARAAFPDNTLVASAVLLQFVVAALAALPYIRWAKRIAKRRSNPSLAFREPRATNDALGGRLERGSARGRHGPTG